MAAITQYVDLNLNQNQLIASVLENRSTAPSSPVAGQWYYNTSTFKFLGWNGTSWVDLSQIITSAVNVKGEIANAASSPAYPASPSSGDMYFITTQAGTVGGTTVEIGDQLIYGISGWFVIQANLQQATTTIAGYLALGTTAEAIAGIVANKAITPLTLNQVLVSGSYTRKSTTTIASLVANTGSIVSHGFNLSDPESVQVKASLGGVDIQLYVSGSSVNSVTVTSNQTLSNVKVTCIG